MRTLPAILLAFVLSGCSDWGLAAPKPDPIDGDTDLVVDTDRPKPRKPKPKDTDVAQDSDVDTGEPAVVEPPGPVDAPVADAGPDRAVAPLVWITLNGTASYDPGGYTPLVYRWSFAHRPSGSTASLLLQSSKAKPKFFIDVAGQYELKLEVRNTAGKWDPTPDRMLIDAVPDKRFYVQLTWDVDSDLDLHLLKEGADIFANGGDCNYCSKTGNDWGTANYAADNPTLDWDAVNGYGPETTTIKTPSAGVHRVWVHYYGVGGAASCGGSCPRSTAKLDFYIDGVLVDTMSRTLSAQGEIWQAAEVNWPAATITHINTISSTTAAGCR